MATTKAKKEVEPKTEEVKPVVDYAKENEELKQQMAKMMAQMEVLMQAQAQSKANEVAVDNSNARAAKKNVKFVNMTVGGFTIKGNRLYHLDNQFDSRTFTESEAKTIINNMPNCVANGMLYVIADNEFMEEVELTSIYEDLISVEDMKNLLIRNADDVCELYTNANDEQKNIIIGMVENKQLNGANIDANVLIRLSKLCGRDFINIDPLDKEE